YTLLTFNFLTFQPFNYTLDIDLDFRAPEMSIEKYSQTIQKIKALISNAKIITIATSPYFLDQTLALKILKDILV
ncbi:TPA: hypothetical protein DEP21_06015, partial [Patescibacteria group bacterium]|nr:hypothetical protein [Candidatus Gracilibacteria bacterium]